MLGVVAMAKTASTSIAGRTARDGTHHMTCAGRWRGVVSLGFSADEKRIRKKVSGSTKAEVRDKLKEPHAGLDAGGRTVSGYTVEKAVADWLANGRPGRVRPVVRYGFWATPH